MSTEEAASGSKSLKKKKSTSALRDEVNKKPVDSGDESAPRKEHKSSKSGRGEAGEGEKRSRKHRDAEGSHGSANGKGEATSSSPSTAPAKPKTRKPKKPEASGDEQPQTGDKNSPSPAVPLKSSTGKAPKTAPAVDSSEDAAPSNAASSSTPNTNAAATTTEKKKPPVVPPKPVITPRGGSSASSTPTPGRRTNSKTGPTTASAPPASAPIAANANAGADTTEEDVLPSSSSEDSSVEKPSNGASVSAAKASSSHKPKSVAHSGQASQLTDSSMDDSATSSASSKPSGVRHAAKPSTGSAKPPKIPEESGETEDGDTTSEEGVGTNDTAGTDEKPTKTTGQATACSSKTTSHHNANAGGATASSSSAPTPHKGEKKKGGFLSFLSKMGSKKTDEGRRKHGSAGNGEDREEGGSGHRHKVGDGREATPEKRKDQEKRTYVASCVAELPEEWQKKLKKSHLDETTLNQNFEILCNVLHFLTKDSFRMPDQEKEVRERRTYATQQMMDAAKILLETTDNVKRFYKNIEFSGKGGFGRVFAAKDIQTKKRVAIKKLPHASDKDKKNNYCEIAFLSTCNHANIVKFNKAWEFPEKQEVWIVTEFLEGGTLSEAVKVHQFTERHIAYVAREMLKALKYLHGMGYIHRDLKSGNCMMSIDGAIKLIDFGLCCDTVDGERLQMLGSPYWIPPEMIKKKRHGCPADIWSFAVCVLEMYLKEPPHCDSRLFAMFTAASAGLQSAIPARASENARDFLSKCLEINPKKRWTAEQLLTHPFVTAPKLEEGIRDVLRGVFVSNSLALSGI